MQEKLQILTLFTATWGSNGGQKGQKMLTLLKKTPQKRKICTGRWIFFMKNSMLSLIYYILQFLSLFGGALGVKLGPQKVKNYPSRNKKNYKYSIYALVDIFFQRNSMVALIFDKILYSTTLGYPLDPMGSKDASKDHCSLVIKHTYFVTLSLYQRSKK